MRRPTTTTFSSSATAPESLQPGPSSQRYTLKKSWKYRGRSYKLGPGRYEWYVWPGFGQRAAANYGVLLGVRSFRIVR